MGHQTGPLTVCISRMWIRRLDGHEKSFQQCGHGRPDGTTRPGKKDQEKCPKILFLRIMMILITMMPLDVHS